MNAEMLFAPDSFTGVRALVTGAGGGVGRAVTDSLVRCGASVIALDISTPEFPEADVLSLACDITDDRAVAELISNVRGGLDVLVNTAGIIAKSPFGDTDWDVWDRVYAVNCRSTMRLCEALLPQLLASKRGRIVTIASMTASKALPTYAPYSSAKAALLNASRVLAAEIADTGVTVNTISPGWVDTPMTAGLFKRMEVLHSLPPDHGRRFVEDLIPQGRLVAPEAVAAAVLFLASVPGGAFTAVDMPMDGGLTTMFTPGVHQLRRSRGRHQDVSI